jgi:hypothetical protein
MSVTKTIALSIIAKNPEVFQDGFAAWLDENHHIYQDFERRALAVARFRYHYSARTIAEVMRHDSVISETHSAFKLNNRHIPDLGRLFMLRHPVHDGMFETRQSHRRAA